MRDLWSQRAKGLPVGRLNGGHIGVAAIRIHGPNCGYASGDRLDSGASRVSADWLLAIFNGGGIPVRLTQVDKIQCDG